MTIKLNDLANRAKNNNWTITNEEAIDIWLIIPEGCERFGRLKKEFKSDNAYDMIKPMLDTCNYDNYLTVKGLGEFKIQ